MATYTMYWPDWMCDRAREQGLEGRPLPLVWGGHNQDTRFSRFRIGPGDVLVPVTAKDGALYALASLAITQKTTGDAWLGAHPEHAALRMHGCGNEVLGGTPGAPLRFDRALEPAALAAWRFDGSDGPRPIKHLKQGRITRILSMQGVYRVTAPTAALLQRVLAADAPAPPPTQGDALVAALRASPADAQTARVLADAWQEQGDPRGEILALEVALASETDAAAAARHDERLAALYRAAPGLKKKPGGFPWRPLAGARPLLELRAQLPYARGLGAFFGWATGVLAADAVTAVSNVRRTGTVPGARRAPRIQFAESTWRKRGGFTLDEVEALVEELPHVIVSVEAPLRAWGRPEPLPLQRASQWLRKAPGSELHLRVDTREVTALFRVPRGPALADAVAAGLRKQLRVAAAKPRERMLVPASDGVVR